MLAPGGTFLFLLNHPLLQVPGSGWIDDQILGEQYWRIGPYLTEDVSMEELAPGVVLPVRAPAVVTLREPHGGARPAARAHGRAGAAARVHRPGPGVRSVGDDPAVCWCYGQ